MPCLVLRTKDLLCNIFAGGGGGGGPEEEEEEEEVRKSRLGRVHLDRRWRVTLIGQLRFFGEEGGPLASACSEPGLADEASWPLNSARFSSLVGFG